MIGLLIAILCTNVLSNPTEQSTLERLSKAEAQTPQEIIESHHEWYKQFESATVTERTAKELIAEYFRENPKQRKTLKVLMSGAAPVALAVTGATVGVHLLIGVTAAGGVKAVKEYIDGKEFSFTKVAVAGGINALTFGMGELHVAVDGFDGFLEHSLEIVEKSAESLTHKVAEVGLDVSSELYRERKLEQKLEHKLEHKLDELYEKAKETIHQLFAAAANSNANFQNDVNVWEQDWTSSN